MQLCPVPHAVPQLPQCWLLDWVSTHCPLQSVEAVGGHPHLPSEQVWSARHWFPHPPQLAGSLADTSWPLQLRQSSTRPLQSLSMPSPQISLSESGMQAHTFDVRFAGWTQSQLGEAGQSEVVMQVRVHTPPVTSRRTHSRDPQSSVAWQGAPNDAPSWIGVGASVAEQAARSASAATRTRTDRVYVTRLPPLRQW